MIFVDASAILAILLGEPERREFSRIIEETEALTSPIALFEAAQALSRETGCTLDQALEDLTVFTTQAKIRVVAVLPEVLPVALEAAQRFGKGRGHPAQLNLGDCFAYASAKTAGAKLLFKGNDFGLTDIAAASP